MRSLGIAALVVVGAGLAGSQALAAEDERLRGEEERLLADPRYFSREWWSHTYQARGRYAEQLERWLAVFPQEQLLIVPSQETVVPAPGVEIVDYDTILRLHLAGK